MARNVFKAEGDRSGIVISETTKGFKIESWSLYGDEDDVTYFVNYNETFIPGFDKWEDEINEYGTTYWELLVEYVRQGYIKPYRTIVA